MEYIKKIIFGKSVTCLQCNKKYYITNREKKIEDKIYLNLCSEGCFLSYFSSQE